MRAPGPWPACRARPPRPSSEPLWRSAPDASSQLRSAQPGRSRASAPVSRSGSRASRCTPWSSSCWTAPTCASSRSGCVAGRRRRRSSMASAVSGRRIHLVLATSTGGVGTHVRSLAGGLLDRGAHVTVHGAADADALFGYSALGAEFVPVAIAAIPTDRRVRRDPTADIRAVRELRADVIGADIVHAHGLRAGVVTGLAVRRNGPPRVVVTWHNALLGSPMRRRVLGVAERWLARRADVTIGASRDLAERARSLGARRAVDCPVAA